MNKPDTQAVMAKAMAEAMHRSFGFERKSVDMESRTVELAFSSEDPYQRWFGMEILGHDAEEVMLDRLSNAAPLLWNHDWYSSSKPLGVVESVEIGSDKVGRAVVRFSQSAEATEVLRDVADGIISKVSVGYMVKAMKLVEENEDAPDVYRVTQWQPFELSLVAVPADDTVGVGKTLKPSEDGQVNTVTKTSKDDAESVKTATATVTNADIASRVEAEAAKRVEEMRKDDAKRRSGIMEWAKACKKQSGVDCSAFAYEHCEKGTTIDDFGIAVADFIEAEGEKIAEENRQSKTLDLSGEEVQRYSLFRAIDAEITGNWRNAGFERECTDELQAKVGKEARGFFVPTDIQNRAAMRLFSRMRNDALARGNMNAAEMFDRIIVTTAAGAGLVGTEHRDDLYIEALRADSVALQAGVRVLEGLVQNQSIPKQTAVATFAWIAENANAPDSTSTFGTVPLTPHTLAGQQQMTRRQLKQSLPAVEQLIEDDLRMGEALAYDLAIIEGSGAGEIPLGVVNQVGVGAFTLAAPGAPTYDELIDAWVDLAAANAIGSEASVNWITTPTVKGEMMKARIDAGSGRLVMEPGSNLAAGYPVLTSSQLTANRLVLGYWSSAMVGQWGALDVVPDTAALAASNGLVIRVFRDADIAVRHAVAFTSANLA